MGHIFIVDSGRINLLVGKWLVNNSNMLDSFDIVGPYGKEILVRHLLSKLGRPFAEEKYPVSQIESALISIIGEGALILVKEMQKDYRTS